MHPYLNIAVKAARLAGKIIVDAYLHPGSFGVAKKPTSTLGLDFVTTVDRACEETIIKTILRAYPEHNIKAEESGEQLNNSEITWVIDPLDGTLNFIHGFPFFAVSIGILNGEQIEHGVIYNPISAELFTASKGSGAQLNNKRIRCSENNKLNESFLAIDINLLLQRHNKLSKIENFLPTRGLCRDLGSAALHLAFVASGRLDGYCDINLKPWDMAAGALLVRESGGYITDFGGKTEFLTTGNVVAANQKIQKQLLDIIVS
ncbi:MAG: inositol monophosphatase family protein [Gammaproteobacteria bacterium]